jgi:hypothetical protein
MHIDNPTGYDTSKLSWIANKVHKDFSNPNGHFMRPIPWIRFVVKIRYRQGTRVDARVTNNLRPNVVSISLPHGICSTTDFIRIIYWVVGNPWVTQTLPTWQPIIDKIGSALIDNPYLKLHGKRRLKKEETT